MATNPAWYCTYGNGSSTGYYAVTAWPTSTSVAAGVLRRQSAAPSVGNERVFICIVAGTTGGSEPSWTVTKGAKTTDNTVTWQEVTGRPAVNGDANASIATNATTASGSNILYFASTTGLVIGQFVNATNVPAGTKIVGILTDTWVRLSANTTGTVSSGTTVIFSNTPFSAAQRSTNPGLGTITQNNAGTFLFICSTAGTCGAGEPTYDTTTGNTTVDSGCTWTCIGATGSFGLFAAPFARLQTAASFAPAGDTIYVGSNHAETQSASMTITCNGSIAAPCRIYTIDAASHAPPQTGDLSTAATVSTTGSATISIGGCFSAYGLTFSAGTSGSPTSSFANASGAVQKYYSCSFQFGTSGGGQWNMGANATGIVEWVNTTYKPLTAGQTIGLNGVQFTWRDTANAIILGTAPTNLFITGISPGNTANIIGVDLTNLGSNTIFGGVFSNSNCFISNCKLASGTSLGSPATTFMERLTSVATGSAAETYSMKIVDLSGTLTTLTDLVATSGASNGTAYSHKIVSTSLCTLLRPFRSAPMAVQNTSTGANRTLTVEAIAFTPTIPSNADFWIEATYPGSASSPIATTISQAPANPLAATAALGTSSTSWGSALTARQNTQAYSAGAIIGVASNPTRAFFCTTGGTSAGSEPGGYATAVDGDSITDNTAVFRAGWRVLLTVAATSPQPQIVGPFMAVVNFAIASATVAYSPKAVLS